MNIQIPYSWITDFLKTQVEPEEVFRLTTATGPTIESFCKEGNDYLLNIEVTINRPDCLSVMGIAREMFAALVGAGKKANFQNDYFTSPPTVSFPAKDIPLKFDIDSRLSPRFMAVVLKDIKIGPSPDFIKERLVKSGMRSLNNVIDITNYVMLESGQPNHAFDFDKIKGPTLIVRGAKKGEKVKTLDQKERTLETGDIVYEDGSKKLIDLAGIMGGWESEIDSKTTTLLYTVVNDYFAQIRKTAMRLGIQTEASARLSKVLDQEMVGPAMKRAIELFSEYAGAKTASRLFDCYPKKQKAEPISLTDGFIAEKAGTEIPAKDTDRILKSLGFKVRREKDKITVVPPLWRINDIKIAVDVVEEVTRVFGYDNIPDQNLDFALPQKDKALTDIFITEDRVRSFLTGWGYTETMSFSMLSKADLLTAQIPSSDTIKIQNPLTEDWEYMQPCLAVNLLKNMGKNQPVEKLSIFEIANIFDKKGKENRNLCLGFLGDDFFAVKGVLEQLFAGLSLPQPDFSLPKEKMNDLFDQVKQASIFINNKVVGQLGVINQRVFGLTGPVTLAELNLSLILQVPKSVNRFGTVFPYPPIIEDLSFEMPPKIPFGPVLKMISLMDPLIKCVSLIDQYANTRTIRIRYQHPEKNLADTDVVKVRNKIISSVENKFGARARTK